MKIIYCIVLMCNVSYGFSLNATQSKSGNGSGFKTQLSDLSKRAPKIKNRYPVQDAFHFTVDCGELGVTNCAQAKILLRNAGIKIASQILIKTPITVMAAFMPFLSQHFAVANPINVAAMREDGQVLMYPQALLRQSDLSPDFELQPIDMIINLNVNQIWCFGNSKENITESAVDFEYVALHELTHGIGLYSSIVDYYQVMKREIKEEVGHYIGPFIARKQSGEYFFQPISAFDNLIPRFAELGNPITRFKPTGRNARECLDSLEANATLIANAKDLNKLATSEALELPLKNNLAFPLYSPKVFSNSASISHITPSELYTHDFLMTPNAFAKLKVSDAMQAFGSIYGPRTMGVLTLMGYSSVQSISNPLKLKYIDIYEQVPVKLKYDGSIDGKFKKPKEKLKKSNSM